MSAPFLTAKALGKRMKSKGLQRLRWYCQMCERQCRDENAFKCHTRTEAHLRQMALFAESADRFVERFSRQFCDGYLGVLRRQGGRLVKANHVYTQYIADKEHVHMNATKWDTLSSFVSFLGKQRMADVRQDEHGDWLVKHVDRDPHTVARQQDRDGRAGRERSREQEETQRIQAEVDEAARLRAMVAQSQTELGGQSADGASEAEREEREAEDERRQRDWLSAERAAVGSSEGDAGGSSRTTGRLTISLAQHGGGGAQHSSVGTAAKKGAALLSAANRPSAAVEKAEAGQAPASESGSSAAASSAAGAAVGARKRSAIELIMHEEQQRKQRAIARSPSHPLPLPPPPAPAASSEAAWLSVGLVVKLLGRSAQSARYDGQKGRVTRVQDGGHTATVALSDPQLPPLLADQRELQTVIPAIGHTVRIVAGSRRMGELATLCSLSDDQSSCTVRCASDGALLAGMEFEHVCKVVDSPQPGCAAG